MSMRCFLLSLLLGVCSVATGQELNCLVTINSQQVATADRRIFDDMKQSFEQFMNDRVWTEDEYLPEERIAMNLVLTLAGDSDPAVGNWRASVQVQVARPVYGTNYKTILLNYADRDWVFSYVESQPLNFNENAFQSNLTSLLAYYAYMALAFDYDSFAELGGADHIRTAWNIVNTAQTSQQPGWGQYESGNRFNRYWLAQNLLSPQAQDFRTAWYHYHRLGLDTFAQDAPAARLEMVKLIEAAFQLNRTLPNSILIRSFIDAKLSEVVDAFRQADPPLRQSVFDQMSRLAPDERSKLQEMLN